MKIVLVLLAMGGLAQAQMTNIDTDAGVYNTPYAQKNFCAGAGKNPATDCSEWAGALAKELKEEGAVVLKTICASNPIGCTYSGSLSGVVQFVK